MYVAKEVPVEADLKGSEAKLLLHLMRLNGAKATNAELMRGSGVNDRQTFFRAKAKLHELGLLENPTRIFQPGLVSQPAKPNQSGIPTGIIQPPVGYADQEKPTTLPPDHSELPEMGRDYLAEAMQADLMDASGEWGVRNSPKNLRRAAQAKVLMDLYEARFNGRKLTIDSARRWVNLADDSAEEALDAIETAHTRKGAALEHPHGYIEAIIRRKREEREEATTRPANIGSPSGPLPRSLSSSYPRSESEDSSTDDYYRPPSADYLAKMEKLRKAGLLVDEYPDED